MLTNDVISFEQPGPDLHCLHLFRYICDILAATGSLYYCHSWKNTFTDSAAGGSFGTCICIDMLHGKI